MKPLDLYWAARLSSPLTQRDFRTWEHELDAGFEAHAEEAINLANQPHQRNHHA